MRVNINRMIRLAVSPMYPGAPRGQNTRVMLARMGLALLVCVIAVTVASVGAGLWSALDSDSGVAATAR